MHKFLITLVAIPLLILLIFSTNIYGYFKFKSYCSSEGGLRVYEKLERNVGWLAKDKYDALVVASLDGVEFARYTDKKDGQIYDIRYLGGDPQDDSSFKKLPADKTVSVQYKWKPISDNKFNGLNLGRSGYEVVDINTEKVLVGFYMYGFAWFNSDRTPLSTNVKHSCYHEGGKTFQDLPRSLSEIESSFNN